jgi:hypothetical protein
MTPPYSLRPNCPGDCYSVCVAYKKRVAGQSPELRGRPKTNPSFVGAKASVKFWLLHKIGNALSLLQMAKLFLDRPLADF